MKKRIKSKIIATVLLVVSCAGFVLAQPSEKEKAIMKHVDDTNRKIDHAVVKKDFAILEEYYGDDFVFTHGSGHVDSKETWMKTIQNPDMRYVSREHDSTQVELHNDIAIIRGRLSISREDKNGLSNYGVWYVRVYALRKKNWQLISHPSTSEWHE